MPVKRKNTLSAPEECDGTAVACQKALAETCKALKAFSFYPDKHPLREQILLSAHQAITNLTRQGPVSLIVQRNGFAFASGEPTLENTPMTKALAQELFARQLQRFAFLPELSLAELTKFLSLLALPAQKIIDDGGLAGMLTAAGVRSIIVDEIDISAVFTRKSVSESAGDAVDSASVPQPEPDAEAKGGQSAAVKEFTLDELLAAMSAEDEDEKYCQLGRLLLAKGRALQQEANLDRLFGVLATLVDLSADETWSASRREFTRILMQQLCPEEMAGYLLGHLEDEKFAEKETIFRILGQVGAEIVDAVIRRLLACTNKTSRRVLMAALVRIGPPAQPALSALLTDSRWQVVQMAVALLGEIGSREAVAGLALTVSHSETRVRQETIRSLARIGGMEATAVLVGLLQSENQATAVQAITWLGNSRNGAALKPLLQLVMKRDLLGKSQVLKKEAVLAIGRIGDRRALPALLSLVRKKRWLMAGRWHELKVVAVEAIGNLGGETARVFLQALAERNGELARASQAALQSMAQRNVEHE